MTEPTRVSLADHPHLRLVGGAEPEPQLNLAMLYRLHSAYVAKVGFRLLGNDVEVDDLVQDVFIEASRGLSQVRDSGAVRGWLARICVRKSVRRLRRRRLRHWLHLDDVRDWQEDVGALTPEELSDVKRAYRKLEHLPAQERVVWILRHIEGESLDDIARLCNCSKSTVQRRIRSAEAHFDRAGAT